MPAEADLRKGFSLGPWEVLPDRGLLRDGKKREYLEPLHFHLASQARRR